MSKITVVSLGPGSRDHLTLGALNALEKAEKVVLRTEKCDAAAYIREKGYPLIRWIISTKAATILKNWRNWPPLPF